jgi:hypothetical protein
MGRHLLRAMARLGELAEDQGCPSQSTRKRLIPHDIGALLAMLPAGQRRVAEALIASGDAPTYPAVAIALGLHVGTVHRHLARIRERHPDVYAALMAERRRQLAVRHERAVLRAEAHSRSWHRRQANRRYYYRFGRWPWG